MNLLAAEWIKTRSVRSTWLLATATVVVTTLISLLGISGLAPEWQAGLPADYDPTAIAFKGILVGQILIATLGAQTVTNEYATGQLASTLAIAPRRGRLLATKAAVTALVALVTAVLTVACSFGASQVALSGAHLPTANPTDPDVIRALACAAGYLMLTALLGLAYGTITRSSSGALAIIVAVALIVPAVAPGLPGAIGDVAATYWPTTAGQTSYATVGSGPFPAIVGIGVMANFTLLSNIAGYLTLKSRDA